MYFILALVMIVVGPLNGKIFDHTHKHEIFVTCLLVISENTVTNFIIDTLLLFISTAHFFFPYHAALLRYISVSGKEDVVCFYQLQAPLCLDRMTNFFY